MESWAVKKVFEMAELRARVVKHLVSLRDVAQIELVSLGWASALRQHFWPSQHQLSVHSGGEKAVRIETCRFWSRPRQNRLERTTVLQVEDDTAIQSFMHWFLDRANNLSTLDLDYIDRDSDKQSTLATTAICDSLLRANVSFKDIFLGRHCEGPLPPNGPNVLYQSAATLERLHLYLGGGLDGPKCSLDDEYISALAFCTQLRELNLSCDRSYEPSLSCVAAALPALQNLRKLEVFGKFLTFIWGDNVYIYVHEDANFTLPLLESIRLWDFACEFEGDQMEGGKMVALSDCFPSLNFVDVMFYDGFCSQAGDELFDMYGGGMVGFAADWLRKQSVEEGQSAEMRLDIGGASSYDISATALSQFIRKLEVNLPKNCVKFEKDVDNYCLYKWTFDVDGRKMVANITGGF